MTYSVDAGVGASDNLTRVPALPVSEGIATAGVDLHWSETRQRLSGDLQTNLDYLDYLDDTYDSQVVGTANGSFVLGLVPERFTWLLQDSFGQAQTDPFAASTPATQENINYATTGPDLAFKFGSSSLARFFGRYSVTDYERTALANDRVGFGGAIGRAISGGGELMLNAERERIDFSNELQRDYARENTYLSYTVSGRRTQASVAAGYTWLDRGEPAENSGALLRISASRSLSAASRLEASFGTSFADASSSLRQNVGAVGGVGSGTAVTATADPYTTRYATLAWSFNRDRTGFGAAASWNDDSYERQRSLDRKRWTYDAHFDRRVSRTLTLGLRSSWMEDTYRNASQEAREWRSAGSLAWAFGRHLGVRLEIEHFDRSASNPLGVYEENRGFLRLFYTSTEVGR